jgi:glycine cleavage system H protein
MEESMAVLMDGFIGIFSLIAGLLVRAAAAAALMAVVLTPALIAMFGWYWLTLAYDRIVALRHVGRLVWRRDSYYTPGHFWVRAVDDQTVRVGVDDIAQRVLPDIESIALIQEGSCVRQGEPIADIRSRHGRIVLRTPIDGTIAAVNPWLVNAPTLVHRDPYRRGWFVDIVTGGLRPDGFLADSGARAWLADEERRLDRSFESALGMAAADGGELTRTASEALSEDQWSAIRAAFLEPPASRA